MNPENITYHYSASSGIIPISEGSSLMLSSFTENRESINETLFGGRLLHPQRTARCLTALASVVQSRFTRSPAIIAAMHDPIITVGDGTIRFEGFSGCAGIYARVDLPPDAVDGEFAECGGTTNVDFNSPMLFALGGVRDKETLLLSVGHRKVAFGFASGTVVERKVPLPQRWLKGLTSVQQYLAGAEVLAELNRVQITRLFQNIPRGKTKGDFYLAQRGRDMAFSAAKSFSALAIGGIERLRLLVPLLPHADRLRIFAHPSGNSTTWQLYFGPICFSCSISREPYRGFSGEGAGLEALAEELPSWLPAANGYFDAYGFANRTFSPDKLARDLFPEAPDREIPAHAARLAQCLAAMGLLGYDLDARAYFYRKLPYKAERILSLNPRLKNALKLVQNGRVEILSRTDGVIEGRVEGSGVLHTVVLAGENARCTCAWMGTYGGSRGPCKHILAVKKLLQSQCVRRSDAPLQ